MRGLSATNLLRSWKITYEVVPLNYGEAAGILARRVQGGPVHSQRQVQMRSIELSAPACARNVKRCAIR